MPIKEYVCTKCKKIHEEFTMMQKEDMKICPNCGSELKRSYTGGSYKVKISGS